MKNEFALAFNEILEEKQLPKEVILQALESAMVSAYRRAVNASSAQHVEAKVDPDTGQVTIFAEKEVVEDVQDERTEVLLDVARKVDPDCNLDDMVVVESTPRDFGRVAAQTARQVIQQRIREAERSAQMQYFERQLGEIVSGVVQAISSQSVTLGLDMKAEGALPANQKIPGERFHMHDRVRAIVLEVKDGSRGPQIVLSRSHRNFLRRLLENEVPEIYHGIVEVRAIAREPGQRAKVAVYTSQSGVDPVGACVGIKGVRIQAIVKELHDEKIDIIEWNPDPVIYISKAISPARVSGVYLNEDEKTATVVVQEDQLSLAIGRDGQNARLAAKLTGWRIDIKSIVEAASDVLAKLQTDESLANTAKSEAETMPLIEEILAKKAENRPVTPEEYTTLTQFVDRVERRTMERMMAERKAEEEKLAAAREGIPETLFEQSLDVLGLPDHVYTILTEAEYSTAADLIVAMRSDPDKVLGLSGIGPKAMQAIDKAVEEAMAVKEEPEPEPELAVEEVAAEGEVLLEAESVAEVTEPEAEQGEPVAEAVVEAEPEASIVVKDDDEKIETTTEAEIEEAEDVSFDTLFSMRPEVVVSADDEEDDDSQADGKKGKKKKKKKSVKFEYDEDLGEVVSHKKHKRGDDWDEEW